MASFKQKFHHRSLDESVQKLSFSLVMTHPVSHSLWRDLKYDENFQFFPARTNIKVCMCFRVRFCKLRLSLSNKIWVLYEADVVKFGEKSFVWILRGKASRLTSQVECIKSLKSFWGQKQKRRWFVAEILIL